MNKSDIGAALLLLSIALLCLVWVIPAHTSPPQSEFDLPPSFMPNLSMLSILVLGGLLFFKNVARRLDGAPSDDDEEFGREASGVGLKELRNLSIWACAAIVSVFLMQYLGYEIVGSLLLIATMVYAGQRNFAVLFFVGIGFPALIWQITWHAFAIQLPMINLS
jgi:hypothetical protein